MALIEALGIGLLSAVAYLVMLAVGGIVLGALIARLRPLWAPRRPFDPSQAARLRGRMRRMARPTLLLIPTKTPGFSKLGGEPEMPLGSVWPVGGRGPLSFVAQLDLAEVRAASGPDWLPEAGALYVFNDDERYGFPDHVRVLFSRDEERVPLAFPPELRKGHRFGERRAGFLPMTSMPSLDWLGVGPGQLNVSDEELDELADAPDAEFGDELQHRIGGYPGEIQNNQMALECEHLARGLELDYGAEIPDTIKRASRTWRLLLQVDYDPGLGMEWGDAGRLYVFIREHHARAGKFSKTVSIAQTH